MLRPTLLIQISSPVILFLKTPVLLPPLPILGHAILAPIKNEGAVRLRPNPSFGSFTESEII